MLSQHQSMLLRLKVLTLNRRDAQASWHQSSAMNQHHSTLLQCKQLLMDRWDA
jgi:hypothetical protein